MDGLRGRGPSAIWHHGDRSTAALDPRAWYDTVCERGLRKASKASETQHTKRDAEKAGKVEFVPGRSVGSLKRFRAALIGPAQGLPMRRLLRL